MEAYEFADIVEYYTMNQRDFDAETCLRIALNLYPDDEDLILQKAYMLKNAGKWEEASDLVTAKIGSQQRSYKMFMLEYAVAHLYFSYAFEIQEQILQLTPKDFDYYDTCEEAAEIFFDYAFYERSVELLREIPSSFDRYKQSHTLLAASYFRLRQYDKAMGILNKLIDSNPYDITLWTEMADGQFFNKRYKEAIDSCDYALAIKPEDSNALRVKIKCCHITGDYDEVINLGCKFIKSNPSEVSILIAVAEAYYAKEELIEAYATIHDAYSICPIDSMERPRILLCQFKCLIMLGMQDTLLLSSIRTTLSYGYFYFKVYLTVARILFEKENFKVGIETLRYAAQCDGTDADEQAKVSLLLFDYRQFQSATEIWNILAPVLENTAYAPYLAYAFRKMKMPYARYMKHACELAKDTTQKLFADEFPGKSPEQYVEIAEKEDLSFSNSGGRGKFFSSLT